MGVLYASGEVNIVKDIDEYELAGELEFLSVNSIEIDFAKLYKDLADVKG
ncbi:hypothetical protein [Francisella persica]|nr:hypothetical protein [Francisella persica]